MKAAVLENVKDVNIKEIPSPEISDNEVLVHVKAAGLCGTDSHIFAGNMMVSTPLIMGHEICGEICEVGADFTDLSCGMKVAIDPNISCGSCFYCRRGEVHLCPNLEAVGVTRHGGFTEYVRVPRPNVFVLPNQLSCREGAMVEPVSCCLHGIDRAGIKAGDVVTILGGGAIGLILAQLASISGASQVFISEPDESRQQVAGNLGLCNVLNPEHISTEVLQQTKEGADIVIEAAGNKSAARQSFDLARRGGTILFFGVCPESVTIPVAPFSVYEKELTIKGCFLNPFTTERAVQLVAKHRIEIDKLITHEYELAQLPELFSGDLTASGLKTVLHP